MCQSDFECVRLIENLDPAHLQGRLDLHGQLRTPLRSKRDLMDTRKQ